VESATARFLKKTIGKVRDRRGLHDGDQGRDFSRGRAQDASHESDEVRRRLSENVNQIVDAVGGGASVLEAHAARARGHIVDADRLTGGCAQLRTSTY